MMHGTTNIKLEIQDSPFQGHNKYKVESQKPALSEAQVRNIMWLGKSFALLNFIFSVLERKKSLSCCKI
jgi:hypothetical protein